jgi:hypothetical protein
LQPPATNKAVKGTNHFRGLGIRFDSVMSAVSVPETTCRELDNNIIGGVLKGLVLSSGKIMRRETQCRMEM